jgi:hypothetical protein
MFKGARPQGQPRSLRAIAEDTDKSSNFPEDVPYVPSAGLPASVTGATQTYKDSPADPMPFKLRG